MFAYCIIIIDNIVLPINACINSLKLNQLIFLIKTEV